MIRITYQQALSSIITAGVIDLDVKAPHALHHGFRDHQGHHVPPWNILSVGPVPKESEEHKEEWDHYLRQAFAEIEQGPFGEDIHQDEEIKKLQEEQRPYDPNHDTFTRRRGW